MNDEKLAIQTLQELLDSNFFGVLQKMAFNLAILALEKQQYFRNCKDCGYLDGNCNHDICTYFDIEVNPELDGCTFGEVENEY